MAIIAPQVLISAQTPINDTPITANPGRPTVSTPATLTPVGYLQFESGFLVATKSGDFSARESVNQVTKLAVTPRIEFLLQSEPLVGSQGSSHMATRPGEVFAGVQGILIGGDQQGLTVAASYIRRLHQSPAPEFDSGTFRQDALVLMSDEFRKFHVDANVILSEQVKEPVRRGQFGQTLSLSRVYGKTTLSGEIWHFTQPLIRDNAVGNLWAASYQVKPNLIVDAGFERGLTSSSTKWETFVGFTDLLPHRLWKAPGITNSANITINKVNKGSTTPQSQHP
jgi:hypothetical protein